MFSAWSWGAPSRPAFCHAFTRGSLSARVIASMYTKATTAPTTNPTTVNIKRFRSSVTWSKKDIGWSPSGPAAKPSC